MLLHSYHNTETWLLRRYDSVSRGVCRCSLHAEWCYGAHRTRRQLFDMDLERKEKVLYLFQTVNLSLCDLNQYELWPDIEMSWFYRDETLQLTITTHVSVEDLAAYCRRPIWKYSLLNCIGYLNFKQIYYYYIIIIKRQFIIEN